MQFRIVLSALVLVASVAASNVFDLDSSHFADVIGKGKGALVEFFAPWCGHCKNLAPTYEELADAFAHEKDKVIIAKVDADGKGKDAAMKYGVSSFPTLRWFNPNSADDSELFEGGRELDTLAGFVTAKSGVKSKIKPPPQSATLIVDSHSFNEVVMDEDNGVFVAFTAPWCGHCKKLKPTLEQVAVDFIAESNCIVANFDADAAPNKPLAQKYGVNSYPTIKFFGKGKDAKLEPEAYNGGRTEADIVNYLNEKCGTHRAVGGLLNENAGRLPALDELAQKFYSALPDMRDSIYKEAVSVASAAGAAGKHYLRVMDKLANGTEGYLEKEASRLASILSKRTLSAEKLDEIKVKANILKAFVAKKVEEAEEKVHAAKEEL